MEGMEFFLPRHIPQRNADAVACYGSDFDALCARWRHIIVAGEIANVGPPTARSYIQYVNTSSFLSFFRFVGVKSGEQGRLPYTKKLSRHILSLICSLSFLTAPNSSQ
jgi:hypothetical protein